MTTFTWLHLTDLHGGQKGQWYWPNVRENVLNDLENLYNKIKALDLVLFTGDLAFSGQPDDYHKVNEILDALWATFKELGCSPFLLPVPGNHDLVWQDSKKSDVRLFRMWNSAGDIREEFWTEPDAATRQVVNRAFANYTIWRDNQPYVPKNLNHGLLPGDFSFSLKKDGAKLGIVGLNTAFLQLVAGDYEGKLALHTQQFHAACPVNGKPDGPAWAKQHHACLLLTHHPPKWLNAESQQHFQQEIFAQSYFAAQLCGHNHEAESKSLAQGFTQTRHLWLGRSLFGLEYLGTEKKEKRLHGYTVGQIRVSEGAGSLLFWPREARLQGGVARTIVPDYGFALTDDQHTKPEEVELLQPYTPPGGQKQGRGTGRKPLPRQPEVSDQERAFKHVTDDETEIRNYCQKIEALHERIPLMGFKTALRVPIRIEDIYVPLRAMIDERLTGPACFADAEEAEKALQEGHGGREISLPDALIQAKERHRRGIVILGDPGSGKTTHLKRVLLWCLRGGLATLGLPQNMIPVFLPLRELKDVSKNLDDFIQDQLSQPHLGTPEGFGKRLLERGNLLFLLDGLDEVADTRHRTQISRWIERALTIYQSCRFVVTCRFAGYTDETRLNETFLEMHIRPMTTAQAEAFVRNWYRIVETSRSSDKEQAKIIAGNKADDLIQRLREPDFRARRVFELTRNPLLLTNICLVHLSRGNLPHTRAALYDECTDVLLERWRGARGIRTRVTSQSGRKVLQPAAYWLHQEEGRTRATAEELAPVIEPVLRTIGWPHGSAQEFLQAVRDDSGLLTGWDQEHYGFMHLGFQEYLAAREIQNKAAFKEPAILWELASKFGESWWQEVILLLLALDNPSVFEPFMREVLKRPVFATNLNFIEMCLDDAAEKSLHPFRELIELEPGQDQDLWTRQFLALQLVARMDPEVVEPFILALRQHPSQKIRQWLQEQIRQARQNVIYAERGGYELVFIPGGVFMMGSPETEEGRDKDETLHEVQVSDFYMGRYPVTNEEYGRFLADNPDMQEPEYWGDRNFNQPNQPVVGVSWYDAQKYAEWAGLRLPSEAQWEYACRAGTATRYYTGDSESDLDRAGWYAGNSGGTLHPVGEKEPNAFGLYDMHGNVWEWCQDWYAEDYYQKSPKEDPVGPESGSIRVIRGGIWGDFAGGCRAALRAGYAPGDRGFHVGFRLLRTPS